MVALSLDCYELLIRCWSLGEFVEILKSWLRKHLFLPSLRQESGLTPLYLN